MMCLSGTGRAKNYYSCSRGGYLNLRWWRQAENMDPICVFSRFKMSTVLKGPSQPHLFVYMREFGNCI